MDYERTLSVIQRLRPYFQEDGGDLQLVEVTHDGLARVRLTGNCVGCPSASVSLYLGLEMALREEIPELTGVELVNS